MAGPEIIETGYAPIKAWISGVPVEDAGAPASCATSRRCRSSISHVAVMPDVHFGIGATVGSVIPTKGAIIPAAVGVDIGCGMMAVRTTLTRRASAGLARARCARRSSARAASATARGGKHSDDADCGGDARGATAASTSGYDAIDRASIPKRRAQAQSVAPARHARRRQPLHRGLPRRGGPRVGDAALGLARHRQPRSARTSSRRAQEALRARARLPRAGQGPRLSSRKASRLFDDYVEAVGWAQDYARANREVMMERVAATRCASSLPKFELGEARRELPPQLRRAASSTSATTCG